MRRTIGLIVLAFALSILVLGSLGVPWSLPSVAATPAAAPGAVANGAPTVPRSDTSKLVPLTELKGSYKGAEGGLYPDGSNRPPRKHLRAGIQQAGLIQPVGLTGTPDPRGKIVLLSVGMSNTTQEFQAFQRLLAEDKEANPAVVAVDGAQGAMPAAAIVDPDDQASGSRFWTTIDTRLQQAGLSRAQVQVVWLKEANARPMEAFPEHARILQRQLAEIARVLRTRFPRLRIVYLSSRIYGGYASTPLNPEPYAYESAFAVKWLIEDQIEGRDRLNFLQAYGPVYAPWLAWGPYLWANGSKPRRDGLTWLPEDVGPDGTHPSPAGRLKVAHLLLGFLKSDPTAKAWFLRGDGTANTAGQ